MHEINWDALVSALAGSSLVGVLVRSFLTKTLRDLDEAVQKIIDIKTELARVTVRLENFEKTQDLIVKLDRKVAALEMKVYGPKQQKEGI